MAALIGVGAFAVHQLRFMLGYGHGSGDALAHQGHAYLVVAGPLMLCAATLAAARWIDRLMRGARPGLPRLGRLWGGISAVLVAVYCIQESVEGLLASGHPGAIGGVLGHGGWLCVPLSAAVGLVLALALRATTRAADLLVHARRLRPRLPAAPLSIRSPERAFAWRAPWSAAAAARAPPAASVRSS
jgi:hypothetical protein